MFANWVGGGGGFVGKVRGAKIFYGGLGCAQAHFEISREPMTDGEVVCQQTRQRTKKRHIKPHFDTLKDLIERPESVL